MAKTISHPDTEKKLREALQKELKVGEKVSIANYYQGGKKSNLVTPRHLVAIIKSGDNQLDCGRAIKLEYFSEDDIVVS